MKYTAERKDDKYLVSGIKEMETINGDKVEVIVDTKEYDEDKLKEVIVSYTNERDAMFEQYNTNIKDLTEILEAINQSK